MRSFLAVDDTGWRNVRPTAGESGAWLRSFSISELPTRSFRRRGRPDASLPALHLAENGHQYADNLVAIIVRVERNRGHSGRMRDKNDSGQDMSLFQATNARLITRGQIIEYKT